MSNLIAKAGALATKMMTKHAVKASLIKVTGGNDRLTGKRSEQNQIVACEAVIGLAKRESSNGLYLVRSVATLTVEPKIGDRLEIGKRVYTFETVEEIAPDGNPILWKGVVK